MTSFYPSRRAVLALAGGSMAAACVPFEKTSPFWGTIAAGFKPGSGPSISRQYTDGLPYASMLTWFEGSPKALLILAEVTQSGRLVWYSAERQVITTQGPFVVGALGFDIELRGTQFGGGWQPNPLNLVGKRTERTLDIAAENRRIPVSLTSRFTRKGLKRIDILGVDYDLELVAERVSNSGRPRYENRYWVEASSGRTWKSQQVIIPTMPPLNIEMLKYPAS